MAISLRSLIALSVCGALVTSTESLAQQPRKPAATKAATPFPERAVRRDIPMTKTIQRAFAAGTRDSTGRPGPRYWQLWTDYTIHARLDPKTSVLTGQETIVIHNTSPEPLAGFALHLDQNMSRPEVMRLRTQEGAANGGMTINKLTVNGEEPDLTTFGDFGHETIQRVLASIEAGSSATVQIDWQFTVPEHAPRMGRWGDSLYQLGQWYPRVAVYDDLRGWNIDPYLTVSEFYNNFGRFDVTIDVPAGWLVGATGILRNPEQVLTPAARERLTRVLSSDSTITIVGPDERGPGKATAAGDRLQWHFVADTVTDFAWATSDRYVWDATRATIPGRGTIPVHFYSLPDAVARTQGPAVVRHALEYYSKLWMPFAFPQMTMTQGPEAGMEYPMFIMSGLGAADHEVGHQWWPMMVSNNETWYGWMDEGFNQYMNILSDADAAKHVPNLNGRGQQYGSTSGSENEKTMMSNANLTGPSGWTVMGDGAYTFTTYLKTPMMLSMLGGIVGDSAVQRAMSEYAHTWRFKHPSPWDFMFIMNHALKRDLSWFWYYWLFTTESVDAAIANVTTTGAQTHVTVRRDGQMPAPVVLQFTFAPTGPKVKLPANAVRTDSVTAVITYPVDVWFAGSRTFDATLNFGGRKITRIQLDPQGRFPDRDPKDNLWPRDTVTTTK